MSLFNNMTSNGNSEKKMVDLLRNNDGGLTITELVNMSRLSRSTVRVVLARLEGGAKISFRKIGMAKMYVLGESKS